MLKKTVNECVSVNHITSLTRAEEKKRQETAKEHINSKSACMCPDKNCRRFPADGCKYNLNSFCCQKQGGRCHFHNVVQTTSTEKQPSQKYNLSSPGEIRRVCLDFVKDLRLSIKMSKSDNQKNLDSNIASAGLRYREPRTPGDGNCMFHALADQECSIES